MIETLHSLDVSLFLFLNSFHYQWLDSVMLFFSGQAIWIPFIVYFFWSARTMLQKRELLFFGLFLVLAIVASDSTASYVLKNAIGRLRPCHELDLKILIHSFGQKCGGKLGFVSSHAANAFAMVLFSLRALRPTQRWAWTLLIIPIVVSYSRVYLGVHYPGDILGGAVVGIGWGWFFSWVFRNT